MQKKHRILAVVLALVFVLSFLSLRLPTETRAASQTWNVLCTSLPTAATNYYAGFSYSIDQMKALSSSTLITYLDGALNGTNVGYAAMRYLFVYSDGDPTNSSNLLTFFAAASVNGTWDSGETFNREHVWANSKGGSIAEGDMHHIRPTNKTTNSVHGNYDYGTVGTVTTTWSETGAMTEGTVTGRRGKSIYSGADCWEPSAEFRGDTARIVAYVYVNYYSSLGSKLTSVVDSYQTLLKWNAEDPVDEWEMARNNYVQTKQGNRNIFIDHPELMYTVFGEAIPDDLITPCDDHNPGGTSPTPGNSGDPTATPTATPVPDTGSDWVLTSWNSITDTDNVVITMTNGSTVYALNHANGSSALPAAGTVHVTSDGQRLVDDPDATLQWGIKTESGGKLIHPFGNTTTYLYTGGANNGLRVGTASGGQYWTLGTLNSAPYLMSISDSRFLGVYLSNPDWRTYLSTNATNIKDQTIRFYVWTESEESTTPEPVTPEPVTPEPVTPEPVTPEPVTPEPQPTTLRGDADCDGTVTAADAALILRYLSGLADISEQGLLNAELTNDVAVSAGDAALILRWLAGLVNQL